jgi:carboxymethylenebutenolidase
MKSPIALGLAAAVLVSPLAGPVLAGPIQPGSIVTLTVRKEAINAYAVRPSTPGFHSGVVLVHEWWGLNDQIKGVADRFAEEGYSVMVPDLYRGKLGTDQGLAHELMRGLNQGWVIEVLDAANTYLRTLDGRISGRRPAGTRMPIAYVGFCMGGGYALQSALKGSDVQGVVMFYGAVETDKKALDPLNAPLLGIFGNEDRGIPLDQIKAFDAALKEAGKKATVLVYPGVGHAFFNEERPSYDAEASKDAWARTTLFLKDSLVPEMAGQAKPQGSKLNTDIP